MACILLVDDDAAALDLVRRALETDGHTVSAAEDGDEGLRLLAERPEAFDLLVTDVQMPVLDGIRLADRAHTIAPEIRIVIVSGYGEQLQRAQGLRGSVRTLLKPFTLDQIRAEIRESLAA